MWKKYIYNLHDFCTCRYTLLVGKPPFETSCLKDTYMKIKKNEYHVPSRVSLPAKNLIMKLLKGDPTDRPNMDTLLEEEFFHTGKKQNDAGYNIVIYKKVLQFVTEYSCPCLKFLKIFFFWFVGYLPPRLPTSCLTMAPRFDTLARSEALSRRPLLEINRAGEIH